MVIDSELCLLDIRSCMLENREPIRAMEFDDRELHREIHGNKEEAARQVGNVVPEYPVAARVRAALAPQL